MRVQVAYAAPGVEERVELELAAGAVAADAVRLSGLPDRLGIPDGTLSYAIHGQRANPDTPLRDGDRLELLRPLVADPKAVRRRRAVEHPLPRPASKVKRRRPGGDRG
jgi:putative ubiquitin-RnfH superfamily antitoxin RatB of RatAB toxin-antitoxin module